MTNEQIKKDVLDNLYWDSRVDSSNIEIEVENGEVTLKGEVPSYSGKRAAVNDTWSVAGVIQVNENLEVKYPESIEIPADSEIETNVMNSLIWDVHIDSTEITVSVNDGIVSLEGNVDEYWKLKHAEIKSDVLGVIDIVNKLIVIPTESVLDKDIGQEIVSAMARSGNVDVDNINIEVKNGVVTLRGKVGNHLDYERVEDLAELTLGVIDVKNQLVIEN